MHQDNPNNGEAFPQDPKSVEGRRSSLLPRKTRKSELVHGVQDIDTQSIYLPRNRKQQKFQKQLPCSIHSESALQRNKYHAMLHQPQHLPKQFQ
jgi:hypothetical protein